LVAIQKLILRLQADILLENALQDVKLLVDVLIEVKFLVSKFDENMLLEDTLLDKNVIVAYVA
jgi:hypothetical protein